MVIFCRSNGYSDLADRLVELQYELTDRMTCFIGGKRPDHKLGPHVILPELNERYNQSNMLTVSVFFISHSLDVSDPALLARKKLQQVIIHDISIRRNHLFISYLINYSKIWLWMYSMKSNEGN